MLAYLSPIIKISDRDLGSSRGGGEELGTSGGHLVNSNAGPSRLLPYFAYKSHRNKDTLYIKH